MSTSKIRLSWRALVMGAVVAMTLGVGAGVAGAHGGAASVQVEATAAPEGVVDVRARVRYDGDGHGVEGATLVVQPVQPDGTPLGVAPMEDQGDGYYVAQLSLPTGGDWTLVVSSDDPEVRTEVAVTVDKATPDTTPEGEPIPIGEGAADNGPAEDGDEVLVATNTSDDDSSVTLWVIGGIILVVLLAIAVVPIAVARSRATANEGDAPS